MGKNKKPRKKYVPPAHRLAGLMKAQERRHYINQFASLNTTFTVERANDVLRPFIDTLVEMVDTGDLVVDKRGRPLFMDPLDGEYAELIPALAGTCNAFALIGGDEKVAAIRRMLSRLDLGMPLFSEDVTAAMVDFEWMRDELTKMTPTQFIELTKRAEELQADSP